MHPGSLPGPAAALADAGIPLGSQTVLLKGINDSVAVMTALMHHLMRMRVKPYYLYQCDPISGSGHFRTPIATGLEIIRGMRGFTTGYAVPTYVVDAPGGGGKIPLMPEYALGARCQRRHAACATTKAGCTATRTAVRSILLNSFTEACDSETRRRLDAKGAAVPFGWNKPRTQG